VTGVEVWLYGSAARGDSDELSDIDLLVVGEPGEETDLSKIAPADNISVSRYAWDEIDAMVGYGSLFLQHVKQEGRPLMEQQPPRLRRLLDQLPAYARADQELDSFSLVVTDVHDAAGGDYSPQFELAVLATAARHAAILGCYLIGEPHFGRSEPFRVLLPRLGFSAADIEDFQRLYRYRVSENLGEVIRVDGRDEVLTWVARVATLIARVRELPR